MSTEPKAYTIAEQWATFQELVIPKHAPALQTKEMRRAFYAGFEASLRIYWHIGDDAVSDDAGVAIMEGLHQECILFGETVQKGEA